MRKSKTAVLLLIASNVVTLSVLLLLLFHYSVPVTVFNKLGITIPSSANSNYKYTENYAYDARRSIFQVYKPKSIRIVMLGNSITYGADWNELLTRTDVANRGIGYDITEGFINRLTDVYSLNPKTCFIMGGINDIRMGISVNQIVQNYTKIVKGLQDHDITPIIQSTLYVSKEYRNWKKINKDVDELNTMIKEYANKEGLVFLDINSRLSKDSALDSIYTYDGLHLLGNGYAKWRDLILSTLSKAQ
jgi:lysophospholipase L1-like esterase